MNVTRGDGVNGVQDGWKTLQDVGGLEHEKEQKHSDFVISAGSSFWQIALRWVEHGLGRFCFICPPSLHLSTTRLPVPSHLTPPTSPLSHFDEHLALIHPYENSSQEQRAIIRNTYLQRVFSFRVEQSGKQTRARLQLPGKGILPRRAERVQQPFVAARRSHRTSPGFGSTVDGAVCKRRLASLLKAKTIPTPFVSGTTPLALGTPL